MPTQSHNPRYLAWVNHVLTERLTADHVLAEFGADTDGMAEEILRLRRRLAADAWTDAEFAHFPDA